MFYLPSTQERTTLLLRTSFLSMQGRLAAILCKTSYLGTRVSSAIHIRCGPLFLLFSSYGWVSTSPEYLTGHLLVAISQSSLERRRIYPTSSYQGQEHGAFLASELILDEHRAKALRRICVISFEALAMIWTGVQGEQLSRLFLIHANRRCCISKERTWVLAFAIQNTLDYYLPSFFSLSRHQWRYSGYPWIRYPNPEPNCNPFCHGYPWFRNVRGMQRKDGGHDVSLKDSENNLYIPEQFPSSCNVGMIGCYYFNEYIYSRNHMDGYMSKKLAVTVLVLYWK